MHMHDGLQIVWIRIKMIKLAKIHVREEFFVNLLAGFLYPFKLFQAAKSSVTAGDIYFA